MNDGEEKEELAICSLLDDYDASGALEWLSPLYDAMDATVTDVGPTHFTFGSDDSPPEAMSTTASITRLTDAARHAQPHSQAVRPRAKQKDPNRARRERRLELVHLRRQAAELESHLDEMRRDDASTWSSLAIAGDVESSRPTLRIVEKLYPPQRSMSPWEEFARDEWTKRLRAETENTRLRLLVSGQVKTANQLRRILAPKRPRSARSDLTACIEGGGSVQESTQLPLSDALTDRGGTTTVTLTPTTSATTDYSPISFTGRPAMSTSQIFDMLKHSVVRARRDMDALFASNGLVATEKAFRSARVEQNNAQRAMMELAANKALPYDLESTRRVAWRHFIDSHPQMPDRTSFQFRDNQQYVELDGVDDILAASYTSELGNGFVSGKFDEWRVVRQFVEPDRVIIICCIVSELTEFASKPASGIRTLKEIYIVLRRPSRCAGNQESRGSLDPTTSNTLMQTYYRFQPVQYKTTPGLENTLAAVTDFMFGFIGGRISLNYQMIEQELQATAGY